MPLPSNFRQRLGYYLTGLAIGFTILGLFWYARAQAAKHQAANTPPARLP